ncbi:MAG TPA: VWA domain-containing protein [Chthoniobacterales bacterium]|nr:VWA domain-containing protein [Chthoniobacterales bacterium]
MTFGEPICLWFLLALPLAAGLIIYEQRRRQKRLEQLVAGRLLQRLADSAAGSRVLIRRILFLGALTVLVFAMARPQIGSVDQSFEQRGRDLVLAIDTSKSMLSTDETPNRLERAKLAAQDILSAMKGDRFGLIAFAGAAQVEAPMTVDYKTVVDAIIQLDTDSVDRGGTDITSAIRAAELALGKSEGTHRAMVLMTDGEDLEEDAVTAAKHAATLGIRIFTVGIGTKQGSEIPLDANRDDFLRDRDGKVVRSRLDEDRLRAIAEQTGGFYVHLDNESISRLVNTGLRNLAETNFDERSMRIPIERYRWPLVVGLLLLLASAGLGAPRRDSRKQCPSVGPAVLAAVLALALSAKAESGLDRYNQGDFDGALTQFRDEQKRDPSSPSANFNLGDAAYRMRRYDEAFEAYSKVLESSDPTIQEEAYYNAGNALFMAGDQAQDLEQQLSNYYDARYLYHQALDRDPGDDQAKKNLRILEDRIKEAERQKQAAQRQQRQQQGQGKRKPRKRNRQQQNQSGQNPDQETDPYSQDSEPDDSQDPGNQHQEPSGQPDSGGDDQTQEEPEPTPKKEGQLRELTPSDQEADKMQQQQQSGPNGISEDEARRLLNSLKDESDRIDLMRRKTDRPVLRDW